MPRRRPPPLTLSLWLRQRRQVKGNICSYNHQPPRVPPPTTAVWHSMQGQSLKRDRKNREGTKKGRGLARYLSPYTLCFNYGVFSQAEWCHWVHGSNQHPVWQESDAFDQLVETDPQWLRVVRPIPVGFACQWEQPPPQWQPAPPPRDAHAGKMLMAEDCPNALLSLHCFICLSVLFEVLQFIWLLVEP